MPKICTIYCNNYIWNHKYNQVNWIRHICTIICTSLYTPLYHRKKIPKPQQENVVTKLCLIRRLFEDLEVEGEWKDGRRFKQQMLGVRTDVFSWWFSSSEAAVSHLNRLTSIHKRWKMCAMFPFPSPGTLQKDLRTGSEEWNMALHRVCFEDFIAIHRNWMK